MLLKTHVEKMPAVCLATIFMKTNELTILATMLMKRKRVIEKPSERQDRAKSSDSRCGLVGKR
jgi:hypothetical protein